MYIVIYRRFKDLTDNHIYKAGDEFPFDNRKIDEARLEELSSDKNKIGQPLIKEIIVKQNAEEKTNEKEEPKNENTQTDEETEENVDNNETNNNTNETTSNKRNKK